MIFTLDMLVIITLILVAVDMLLSVLKLIEEIKLIKNAGKSADEDDITFEIDILDKELHKQYAMMHAPYSDYELYRKCPYRNEFDDNTGCKIWTCPAYGDNCDGELKCKGLKQEKALERKNNCFTAGFPKKR